MATQNGHTDICASLIENNANVNEKRGDGVTPLFMAVEKGFSDLCTLLLKNNAM